MLVGGLSFCIMAENKKSFILYADLIHTVRKLPPDKAGELFLTILSYVNDENPVVDDLLVQVAFEPVRQQLKRDLQRWADYRIKQSVNGKRGGRPVKSNESQENPKNPSLFLESQKSLNANVNANVTANVNAIDTTTDNKGERERKKQVFAPPDLWEVVDYAKEIAAGSEGAPQDFYDYYQSNGWKVGNKGAMKDWRAAFRRWARNEKTMKHDTNSEIPARGISSRTRADFDALEQWQADVIRKRDEIFGGAGRSEAP